MEIKSFRKKAVFFKIRRQLVALNLLMAAARGFRYINREKLGSLRFGCAIAFRRLHPSTCAMTGRVGGRVSFFGLSRFKVKKLAELGLLPGVKRLSW